MCLVIFNSLLKNYSKSYSLAFNGNCLTKSLNIALLLKQKQMLTIYSKLSSEFPRLEGFGLITHINFTHLHVMLSRV